MKLHSLKTISRYLAGILTISGMTTACMANPKPEYMGTEQVHAMPYEVPISLAHGGESIDVLIRVGERRFAAIELVFLRDKEMYKDPVADARYEKSVPIGTGKTPPFEFRVQIDGLDAGSNVHIVTKVVVTEMQSMRFREKYYEDTLFVSAIRYPSEPGIYRVRLTNLKARPDVDWIPAIININDYRGKA